MIGDTHKEIKITTTRRRRIRFRYSFRTLFVLIALFGVVLWVSLFFGPRVIWRFSTPQNVEAIPVTPLPKSEIPADWVRCRFGSLEFRLPPDLAKNHRTSIGSSLVFSADDKILIVSLPADNRPIRDSLRKAVSALPKEFQQSQSRMEAMVYAADSKDFSWWMSQKEFNLHSWLIDDNQSMRVANLDRIETHFRPEGDGLLAFISHSAVYTWQPMDEAACVSVVFGTRSKKLADADCEWIHQVCHSLKFSGEVYSSSLTTYELKALLEIDVGETP